MSGLILAFYVIPCANSITIVTFSITSKDGWLSDQAIRIRPVFH